MQDNVLYALVLLLGAGSVSILALGFILVLEARRAWRNRNEG